MENRFYLTITPEALVSSTLEPPDFGTHLTTVTEKQPHDRALYFDLSRDFQSDFFDLAAVDRPNAFHPDRTPKHTLYLAIYRVLENVPTQAINSMWLATRDGHELELPRSTGTGTPEVTGKFHLYQELCPVQTLVGSTLGPQEFCRFITDPARTLHVPRICFVELQLGPWADHPDSEETQDLPYPHIEHLRDCLIHLSQERARHTMTVTRTQPPNFPFRCVKSGFYLGDQQSVLCYRYPSIEELNGKYFEWWRSASVY